MSSIDAVNHAFVEILRDLLAIPSPPGFEQRTGKYVADRLAKIGYKAETDGVGNVLVRFEGTQPDAPLMMLASHMDEIALIVISIEDDGLLRVAPSGSFLLEKYGEGPLVVMSDHADSDVIGVLSFGSGHVASNEPPSWATAGIATGLSPAELNERGIRVGSPAVPTADRRGPHFLGNPDKPLVAAWTFDDRGGVITLLRLLEWMKETGSQPMHPTIVAFSVQEEGYCLGAKVLAARERPEIFVAVDGSPRPPGSPLVLDGRPCAWAKDSLVTYDPRLVAKLAEAAITAGTQLQTAVYTSAWSDASQVLNIGAAPRVVTFGHVRDNSHGYEVAPLHGFDLVLETLKAFVATRC